MTDPLILVPGARVDVVPPLVPRLVVPPPGPAEQVLVPVIGPRGPKGDPGTADDLAAIGELIDGVVTDHVQAPEPHPAYDDMPSLVLLFENGLI